MPALNRISLKAGLRSSATALALVWGLACAGAYGAASGSATPVVILDGRSNWRVLHSWNAPGAKVESEVVTVCVRRRHSTPKTFRFMTRYPPEGWTAPEFDDSPWPRVMWTRKHPVSPCVTQLSLRGKFTVTNPAKVRNLWLTLGYKGGVVVYLNGKEIARAHLPAGKIAPGSPAEGSAGTDRKMERRPLPVGFLRRGTNVLALEFHAAVHPEQVLADYRASKGEKMKIPAACQLEEVRLEASSASGVLPNVERPKGVQVWNTSIIDPLTDLHRADPHEALRPIRLAGVRNGYYSGRVAVGSDGPIRNLRAKVGDLAGPGGETIPAASVRIGYGAFHWNMPLHQLSINWCYRNEGQRGIHRRIFPEPYAQWEGPILDAPPGETPMRGKSLAYNAPPATGIVHSIWVTVRVPRDAAAGDYRGTLAVSFDGGAPVKVPLELKVIDWILPDPKDDGFFFGMVESPENVALYYEVELWSERHWRLIEKCFDYMAALGNNTLTIPLTAESMYGNLRSMVLWVKDGSGGYAPDLRQVERYVDLALRKKMSIKHIVLVVWDHHRGNKYNRDVERKPYEYPRVSVLDRAGGKIENIWGPKHGTPEAERFWRPALTGIGKILAGRGLEKTVVFGTGSDQLPSVATAGVFHSILPGAGWQAVRHSTNSFVWYEGDAENHPSAGMGGIQTGAAPAGAVPIAYQSNIYAQDLGRLYNKDATFDPDQLRAYGWGNKTPGNTYLMRYILEEGQCGALPRFRTACEQAVGAGRPGFGHAGVDYWPCRDEEGKEVRARWGIYSRFPPTMNNVLKVAPHSIIEPGPDGPVRSVEFELLRESLQEAGARTFLERLLVNKSLPGRLAGECREILDERTRWHRMLQVQIAQRVKEPRDLHVGWEINLSWPHSGLEERTVRLYEACARAARAVGARRRSAGARRPAVEKPQPVRETKRRSGAGEAEEKRAGGLLKVARSALRRGQRAAARTFLKKIVEDYPGTEAAREAERLLGR